MTTPKPLALITGASKGLGLALAHALALAGWDLILTARGGVALRLAAATLTPHASVDLIDGDVTDAEHRADLVKLVTERGGLDALINNAGALGPSPLPHLTGIQAADLLDVLETNVVAPLTLIAALAPHFKPGVRVLNLSSDAAVHAYPGWGAYGASKAALDHASRVLAEEHPTWKVYAVDPGDMRTAMHQAAFPGEDISDRPLPEARVPGFARLLRGDLPSGRYAAPELVAQEVLA
jgi:NAD(P)-dependent dehydrogenase (short-subunit alcohol dehydrogenase family)